MLLPSAIKLDMRCFFFKEMIHVSRNENTRLTRVLSSNAAAEEADDGQPATPLTFLSLVQSLKGNLAKLERLEMKRVYKNTLPAAQLHYL